MISLGACFRFLAQRSHRDAFVLWANMFVGDTCLFVNVVTISCEKKTKPQKVQIDQNNQTNNTQKNTAHVFHLYGRARVAAYTHQHQFDTQTTLTQNDNITRARNHHRVAALCVL